MGLQFCNLNNFNFPTISLGDWKIASNKKKKSSRNKPSKNWNPLKGIFFIKLIVCLWLTKCGKTERFGLNRMIVVFLFTVKLNNWEPDLPVGFNHETIRAKAQTLHMLLTIGHSNWTGAAYPQFILSKNTGSTLKGNVRQLTPVLESNIRSSCPVVEEKDIFKLPGPTSMDSFWGLSITVIYPLLLLSVEQK